MDHPHPIFDTHHTLVSLFIAKAAQTPHAIAVICDDQTLTYGELDTGSNQLAYHLRVSGIGAEAVVPICMGHTTNIIIAMLGVLKAGAAYVPVDPTYPPDRIAWMLEDTACRVVISDSRSAGSLPVAGSTFVLLDIDTYRPSPGNDLASFPEALPAPHDLAYIIYTSGSTGKPKGVMVEHAQILAYTYAVYERLALDVCSSYAILGTFSADAGLTAIWCALCFGGSLHIIDIKSAAGIGALQAAFKKYPVDCYKTTPSLMQMLLQEEHAAALLPSKRLLIGGEACPRTLIESLLPVLPRGCILYNHYGPTETTVGVTTYQVAGAIAAVPAVIPLGKPLGQVHVQVLNEHLEEVPPGDVGELYIGGSFVARGYLNNPELTRQRFIPALKDGHDGNWYKTGDLVRVWPDDNIEYLGRMDEQVKINGHRIELKEIENTILQSGILDQCVVQASILPNGGKYLVAYLVAKDHFDPAPLVRFMKAHLPGYMIPARWVTLTAWPLTFNNKIDKLALPNPDTHPQDTPVKEAEVLSSLEKALLHIWEELLGLTTISRQSDFFQLGGDSLLLVRLSFRISDRLHIPVAAASLFEHLTLEKMAYYLSQPVQPVQTTQAADVWPPFDIRSVSEAQKHLYIQNKLHPTAGFPNASLTFEWMGRIDLPRLERAFRETVLLHESLRTSFFMEKGKVVKALHADDGFTLQYLETDSIDIDKEIIGLTRPFDFGVSPLIRVFVICTKDQRLFLHIDMPHINSDGESLKVIMQDVAAIYNDDLRCSSPLQFSDFQRRMQAYFTSDRYASDKMFWISRCVPGGDFPCFDRGIRKSTVPGLHAACFVAEIPPATIAEMEKYLEGRKITRFQFLLIVYFLLLYKMTHATQLAVMLPVHNRYDPDMAHVVGLLSNVVLVQVSLTEEVTIGGFINSCRESILASFAHQQFPFEQLYRLAKEQGCDMQRVATIFFGYHHQPHTYTLGDAQLQLHIPLKEKENLPLSAAVFDTGESLTIRLSSADGVFTQTALASILQLYSKIADLLLSAPDHATVAMLMDHIDGGMVAHELTNTV